MRILAIALALPLLAASACSTSSAQRSRTTSTGTARTATAPDAGAPAPAASGDATARSEDQVVRGMIRDVTPDSMTIQASDGSSQTLLLVPETSVRIDGQDAHGADLREGLPVRATFDTAGSERIAVQVVAGQGAD